jgi:hypothetical protein
MFNESLGKRKVQWQEILGSVVKRTGFYLVESCDDVAYRGTL